MEREAIKEAVKEALNEELKSFYIDRETHYKQHEFLGEMMKYAETCKSAVLKAAITFIVGAAIGLMGLGFYIKHGFK
jgi:hypothetical protein